MKKNIIMETLALSAALAAGLAAGPSQAATISLQNASITAAWNGAASGMLGVDHGFNAEAGSNVTGLDPFNGTEFLTSDYQFGFDFSSTGLLSIYNNMPDVPVTGAQRFTFDFGATLAEPITHFTLVDGSAVGGVPGLAIVDTHTISVDLGQLTWSQDYSPLVAQVGSVPEPASIALLLAGAAGIGAARRRAQRAQRATHAACA